MPTKTKKKAAPAGAKKKVTRAKAVKSAKPAKKMAKPAEAKPTSFMWKLLEQKEKALKEKQAQKSMNGHFERVHANGSEVYARFNGPRRKAA